ncbi:Eukaryotic translation initiation factor 4E-1 [Cardamine amara subsp. amara]|uniref:Eukaryotic translation initiation factor 4E-1 n=1 Tax=Cardamine amara subsp. amara TaxID=228776 RepID=A0ABD1A1C8_CARAN
MAVEDTPKPVVNEEANPNSIENPIDRYHEEGDDTEEGEIVGGEGDGDVDESSKSAIPQSHPLEHSWTFWFDNPSVKSKQTIWGTSLRSVFTFSTVEEFWSLYNNMRHPSKLAPGADLYCFKHIIEPKWEDPICANGGKWTMTFPKEKSDKSWLYTLLALIGEQFDHGDEICGAVVNIRGKQERISIWTKNFSNEAAQVSIGKQWKEFLDYNSSIGFIIHEDAKKLDRGAAKNAYTA